MARGFISIKDSGLKDIVQYLDKVGDNYDRILLESLKAMQAVVEERIRINWVSMVGGQPGGYVFDSVGQSAAFSKTDAHVVVGTVGVYNIDSVNATHGVTIKQLKAAQIAYWVEFGTSRLKSGIRKDKRVEQYPDEQLVTVAAKPFIGNAYYASYNEQQAAFSEKFNQLMDKIQ